MSTLAEIEDAVTKLPITEQRELHTFLGTHLEADFKGGMTPAEIEAWLKNAVGAGIPGMTTGEVMAMTRGEE